MAAGCWQSASFFYFVKRFGRAFDDSERGTGCRIALVPVLQANEHTRYVLSVAAGAGADGGEHRFDVLFFVFQEIVFRLLDHLQGLLLGRTAGQLHRRGKHAAVFQRQE